MTCQDCIHFDVCGYHITELTQMTVNECPNFKPKSRFVELPCEVGQTVYSNIYGKTTPFVVTKVQITLVGERHFHFESVYEYPMYFDEENIGKTVFLSREAAKKALKER